MDKIIKNELKKVLGFVNSAYQDIDSVQKIIENLGLNSENIKNKYNKIIKIRVILKDTQTLIKEIQKMQIKTFYES